jgi:hypothetical protein
LPHIDRLLLCLTRFRQPQGLRDLAQSDLANAANLFIARRTSTTVGPSLLELLMHADRDKRVVLRVDAGAPDRPRIAVATGAATISVKESPMNFSAFEAASSALL